MNPTVLNVIIALLSVVFGYQLKIIQLERYQCNAEDKLDAKLGFAYEEGFNDGYNAAETEDAEGDTEISELLEKGYLTWEELDRLAALDFLDNLPEDVVIRG